MLGKLLKYEIPALGRKLLPLYIGWAAAAALLGIAIGPAASKSDFMVVITGMLYVAVSTAVLVMSVILIIQRYKNSLLGDEGYFNHVLPVTTSEHIASKGLSALIWVLLSGVIMMLTGIIIAICSGQLGLVTDDLLSLIREMTSRMSGNEWLILLELFLLGALNITKSVLAIYAALTIGHQAQSHITLVSIVAFIGLMILETTAARTDYGIWPNFFSEFDVLYDFHKFFLGSLIITVLLGGIYFFICKYLMEKKLNLA